MTELIRTAQQATMSSREIAELVDSRHDKVKQSIERLAERGVIGLPPLGEYLDTLGRIAHEYRIGKRDSYVIVAQLSPEFTARLVDRWQELEASAAPTASIALPNYAEALRQLADKVEENARQAEALALAAPKVAFVERYVEADSGLKGFRQVAKLLKANEARFREFLIDNRIMYRLGGEWVAHQPHIDAGRFEVKTGEANGHAFNRCLFTPKGTEWVAGLWAVRNLRELEKA